MASVCLTTRTRSRVHERRWSAYAPTAALRSFAPFLPAEHRKRDWAASDASGMTHWRWDAFFLHSITANTTPPNHGRPSPRTLAPGYVTAPSSATPLCAVRRYASLHTALHLPTRLTAVLRHTQEGRRRSEVPAARALRARRPYARALAPTRSWTARSTSSSSRPSRHRRVPREPLADRRGRARPARARGVCARLHLSERSADWRDRSLRVSITFTVWRSDVSYRHQLPGLTTFFLFAQPPTGRDTLFTRFRPSTTRWRTPAPHSSSP
jgi:hypothetical protein